MGRKKSASEGATIERAIRMSVDTGKVLFGFRNALKMAMNGKGKLIIIASNLPKPEKQDMERHCELSNLQIYQFNGTNIELGSTCGKPFGISALWIGDAGNSPLLEMAKKK